MAVNGSRISELLETEQVRELLSIARMMETGPLALSGPLALAPSFSGTKYPGTLDDNASLPPQASGETITSAESNNQSAALKAIETKLGIDNSVAATSFDFLLKNISGGHHHDNVGSRRVTYTNLLSIPSSFAPSAHTATAHTGDILPDGSDQTLGAGSLNLTPRLASGVATPVSGRTVFVDSADSSLKVKTSTGNVVVIEGGGSGGTGGADADATYLITTANGALPNAVVVGATPAGELGGTWAVPTVDDLHAGVAHSAMARLAVSNTFTAGPNIFSTGVASNKVLIARGAASQTGTLQEWQNSTSTALASVASTGVFTFPAGNFGSPVASAPGDTVSQGIAATLSRSDHRHARETPATGSSIADVSVAAAAGVATSFPRSDHVHGHGVGYLPDAHHTRAHADVDHTGATRIEVWDHDALRGTRDLLNFSTGAVAVADDVGNDRLNINIQPHVQVFYAGQTLTWTAMPNALTPFLSQLRVYTLKADLRYAKQVRLFAAVGSTAGTTGSTLEVRFSTTDSNTAGSYLALGLGSVFVAAPITTANTVGDSGWIDLIAGAKIESCYLALFGRTGDGSQSPNFGKIWVAFR
jgi:hypothetical protein